MQACQLLQRSDRKQTLQRANKTTQNIIRTHLQNISDICEVGDLRRAQRIFKDDTHPCHSLFTLLPSGKRYRSIRFRSTKPSSSLISQAVRLLNSSWALKTPKSILVFKYFFLCNIKGQLLAFYWKMTNEPWILIPPLIIIELKVSHLSTKRDYLHH